MTLAPFRPKNVDKNFHFLPSNTHNHNPKEQMQALSELFLKPLRALTGGDIHPGNSDAVQHAFVHNFTENYCNDEEESDRPPFSLQNWNEVLTTSKKDGKFVVIYLHSEMHDDTQTFCEEALRDQGVIDFMNNGQTLVWGADVVSLNLFFLWKSVNTKLVI